MKKYKIKFVITIFCLLLLGMCMPVNTKAAEETSCDIVFALDISGSMKSTDENRTAIETIKMVIDLCDSTDRVGVVAYNDTIAYCYGLTKMETEEERNGLKQNIDAIEYKSETDIGLGLKQAVEMLAGKQESNHGMVILLSDGKTDLEHSTSGRTLEQSETDLQEAVQLAKTENIQIHTIGFASEYLEDGDYLTVLSANTGGTTQIAASPLQLNQMIHSIIFSYKNGENKTTKVMETTGEDQSEEIVFQYEHIKKAYISVLSTGTIYDIQTGLEQNQVLHSEKYAIIKCENPKESSFSLQINGEPGEKVILNVIEVKGSAPTMTPTFTPMPTKLPTNPPVTATPVPIPKVTKNPEVMIFKIIVGISGVTLVVCLLVVYLFFGRKKKEYPQFQGKLIGQFIDLKSKNESVKLEWNLADYPQEGVTLKELFAGANFPEDLPEIDRLCFYPEKNHKILLVHCMSGGVFLEEKNISQNAPEKISNGQTIYVSFAENASELELKYTL